MTKAQQPKAGKVSRTLKNKTRGEQPAESLKPATLATAETQPAENKTTETAAKQAKADRDETIAAIREGLSDVQAGRVKPARKALKALAKKYDIPTVDP